MLPSNTLATIQTILKAGLIIMMFGLIGCDKKSDIKIGFSGCLTGRLSVLGISGRDGVLLATDEINKVGGINGRQVKVTIKDDQHIPETAIKVDQELIDDGVVAIIGHMTSTMSAAAIPLANEKRIVLISPTSTAKNFTGIDDYFIRTALTDKKQTDQLVDYAINHMRLARIAGVYDLSNRAFTEEWFNNFAASFKQRNGTVTNTSTFTSGSNPDYVKIAKDTIASDPEAVVIIAGALDTALISQHINKHNPQIKFISSGWAKSPDLIKFGGPAVEGLILPQTHNPQSQSPEYIAFKKAFRSFTGQEPDFAATGSYDIARLLFAALKETTDPKELKAALLNQKKFKGVQGNIAIDQFGDADRASFLLEIKNGKFVVKE